MRKLAFIVSILCLSLLFFILQFQKPITISSPEKLNKLIPNQLIETQGLVIEEKLLKNYKTFTLDNGIELMCDLSCSNLINKTIIAQGIYDDFYRKIKILKIKEK